MTSFLTRLTFSKILFMDWVSRRNSDLASYYMASVVLWFLFNHDNYEVYFFAELSFVFDRSVFQVYDNAKFIHVRYEYLFETKSSNIKQVKLTQQAFTE